MIFFDTATLSLNGAVKPAEEHITLWSADGTSATTTSTTAVMISDGDTVMQTLGSAVTQVRLFTLRATWNASVNFALETTISASAGTTTTQLYDFTTSALVGSVVTTTSITMTVLRSSLFTLIPSHVYGVTIKSSVGTSTASICNAKLIVLP